MDKETYRFMYPAGIASLSSVFSQKALQWLCGTTTDDNGRDTGNFMLFGDLLARMAFTAGEGKGFRRPLTLSAGQAQYSEEQISTQWNMGRKRIRNLLGRTHGHGAYRHLPFKGGIRDDLPVRPWMDNNGWQPHRQYIFP